MAVCNFLAQFLYGKVPRLRVKKWMNECISLIQDHQDQIFSNFKNSENKNSNNNIYKLSLVLKEKSAESSSFFIKAAEKAYIDFFNEIIPNVPTNVEFLVQPGFVMIIDSLDQNKRQEVYNGPAQAKMFLVRDSSSPDLGVSVEENKIMTVADFMQTKFGSVKQKTESTNTGGFTGLNGRVTRRRNNHGNSGNFQSFRNQSSSGESGNEVGWTRKVDNNGFKSKFTRNQVVNQKSRNAVNHQNYQNNNNNTFRHQNYSRNNKSHFNEAQIAQTLASELNSDQLKALSQVQRVQDLENVFGSGSEMGGNNNFRQWNSNNNVGAAAASMQSNFFTTESTNKQQQPPPRPIGPPPKRQSPKISTMDPLFDIFDPKFDLFENETEFSTKVEDQQLNNNNNASNYHKPATFSNRNSSENSMLATDFSKLSIDQVNSIWN